MPHLIVDAMNVIGSRPTGWWRDRDGAVRKLVARLQQFADATAQPITLIADGRPIADLPEGAHAGVEVLYASRRGRDAADDRIVRYVEACDDPASIIVVTSDRALADRVRRRGAAVHGANWLLDQLDRLG